MRPTGDISLTRAEPVRPRVRPRGATRLLTIVLLCALVCAVALAGCGGSSTSTTSSTTTKSTVSTPSSSSATGVSTASISGLGTVLVNGKGQTLYVFMPDAHSKVTCVSTCAQLWPPLKLSGTTKPTVSGAVNASLLGSDSDPEGGRVVTYAGWPLYTYVADTSPGSATGQGLETNGGLWYVISPAGVVVKKSG